MIVAHPLILCLLLALIGLAYGVTSHHHAIRFPGVSRLTPLASTRAMYVLRLERILHWGAAVFMIVALSQPQWVQSDQKNQKKGIDIVAILDISGSMNAEDFKPNNRMTVAKKTLGRFMNNRPNDRIGLVVFGRDAFTKSPLTFDHGMVQTQIDGVQVGDAGDGTAIGLAVATGVNRLTSSTAASTVIILITDGVNNAGQIDPLSAATLAKNKGITLYTIGIGTKKGAPIPIFHPTYGKRYARHPNGALILTEFDDTTLKEMATLTGGRYFNATNADELMAVYKDIDQLEKTLIDTMQYTVVHDLFPYIIGLIIVMLLIGEWLRLSVLLRIQS